MDETILKRMYDLAYCAGVNNATRPILKNKGLTYDECLQKIKDEQLTIPVVGKSFYCNNDISGFKTRCKEQCDGCGEKPKLPWLK
jgi:hypothetical protein